MIVHSFDPIVLVGGADLGPVDLNTFQTRAPNFVGVDAGADHILAAGLIPDRIIGDLDSLSDATRAEHAHLLMQVSEQDTVDFEKALTRVDAPLIYAIGFSGGRLDHTLAVLDVMGRHAGRRVLLIGPDDVAAVVPKGGITMVTPVGARVSLLPLGPASVQATGLEWSVNDQPMAPLGFSSPSNTANADQITVSADGPVLIVVEHHLMDALAAAFNNSAH